MWLDRYARWINGVLPGPLHRCARYGHLSANRLDIVADAMDAARTLALAHGQPTGARGEVVGLRRDTK